MSSVFINYRTEDEEGSATLIDRDLSRRFGSEEIFRASKSIPPGDDFERAILRAVRRSEVLIAVIGSRWLTVCDQEGLPKIELESDWTRREIIEAFRCDVRVIPVLVHPAERMSRRVLPAELAELATCQYLRLNHRNVAADLASLAGTLTRLVPGLTDQTESTAAASEKSAGDVFVTNHATDNARVNVQGIVHGDVRFGDAGEGR